MTAKILQAKKLQEALKNKKKAKSPSSITSERSEDNDFDDKKVVENVKVLTTDEIIEQQSTALQGFAVGTSSAIIMEEDTPKNKKPRYVDTLQTEPISEGEDESRSAADDIEVEQDPSPCNKISGISDESQIRFWRMVDELKKAIIDIKNSNGLSAQAAYEGITYYEVADFEELIDTAENILMDEIKDVKGLTTDLVRIFDGKENRQESEDLERQGMQQTINELNMANKQLSERVSEMSTEIKRMQEIIDQTGSNEAGGPAMQNMSQSMTMLDKMEKILMGVGALHERVEKSTDPFELIVSNNKELYERLQRAGFWVVRDLRLTAIAKEGFSNSENCVGAIDSFLMFQLMSRLVIPNKKWI